MRILIVSHHFPPEKSGNASRVYDMSINLADSGANIIVLSPHPTFPTGSFERVWKIKICKKEKNNVEVINLWTWQPISRDPKFISRIAYYLLFPLHALLWIFTHPKKFDVIITTAPPLFTHLPGFFAKKLLKKIWVMDVRDLWIDASISLGFLKKGSILEKISRKLEKISCHNADLICVTTDTIRKKLLKLYNLRENENKKLVLIPNGVDIDFFKPYNVEKKKYLIYTGNIGYAQDLENVILAMKYLKDRYDVKLMIVGDGDLREKLEKMVHIEKLSEKVIFTGLVPRKNIPKMLSESLVGLAPLKKMETLEYAVPTKVYEYMACGIPFLGCGEGEIVELAKKSGAGVIADNDPDSIAKAIIELLDNPDKLTEMGKLGREYVKRNYNRKDIANRLKQCIEVILCKQTN